MNDYITPIHFGIQDSVTVALYQYDKGQVLQFDELEEFSEVQFQNGTVKLVHNSQVEVPDAFLTETEHFDAWVQVIGANNETTIKRIHFRIIERSLKDNYIEPEEIPTFREEVQAILNSAKDIAEDAKESAESAKESAESVRETVESAKATAEEAKAIADEAHQLIGGVEGSAQEAKLAKEQAVAAATNAGGYANSAFAYAGVASNASASAKQSEVLAGENANAAQNAAIEASNFSNETKSYAEQAKAAAESAQSVSHEATGIASEARTIAASAESKANVAVERADSAISNAVDAREDAKKSQIAASAAENSAKVAVESAIAAKESSTESRNFSLGAQRAANAASMAASDAINTADSAKSIAQSVRNDADAGKFNGTKGDPFRYEDFTPEQLAALKGKDGYTPERGKDYWTPADVGTINSYVDSVVKPIHDEVETFEDEIVQISDTKPASDRNRIWVTSEGTEHELVEVSDLESAISTEATARENGLKKLNEDLVALDNKIGTDPADEEHGETLVKLLEEEAKLWAEISPMLINLPSEEYGVLIATRLKEGNMWLEKILLNMG